jgi:hypothetical protein
MTSLETLNAELAAIDRQDRVYWRTEKPEQYERLEYLVRQDRRRALVTELLELMQGNKSEGE